MILATKTPKATPEALRCQLVKNRLTLTIKVNEREAPVFENNHLLKPLVRQFDSVGMLLVALVLFRQDFFQPLCLLFCDPLIYRFWVVADEEFLPATVTPERSHLLEAYGFLAATLFYRHCLHVLILDELAILLAATSISLEICFVNLLKPLQPGPGRTRRPSPPWDITLDIAP